MPPVLKVSQLNRYVKSQLESDFRLKELYVAGEIATLTVNRTSGHIYFTLRDENSSIKAVMFAGNAQYLKFMPQSGLAVVARGSATVYERDGTFQIIVSELMLDGASALGFAFEKQKKLLAAKGYFDESKKKAVPQNPKTIGVVTSESGAALHDIISVIERRNPTVQIILAPASVQGKEAPISVAKAINALVLDGRSEVVLVSRGGGTAEDLWCFNDEMIVKTVYDCQIPIISAVGHETDITLCDLAADVRAATPTAAAELVTALDIEMQKLLLAQRINRLDFCIDECINLRKKLFFEKINAPQLKNPEFFVDKNRQRLNNLVSLLNNHSFRTLEKCENMLSSRAALLESLSPLKVLSRGYCIAQNEGRVVTDCDDIEIEDILDIKLCDGVIKTKVIAKEKD